MTKLLLMSILVALVMLLPANTRAEKYDLGSGVMLDVDYVHFTNSIVGDLNAQDGVYVGAEAYKQFLFPNFYLGIAAGWAGTSGSLSGSVVGHNTFYIPPGDTLNTNINYVPVEFNAKYVHALSQCLYFGIGSGISVDYFNATADSTFLGSSNLQGVLWGGQFFGELNYRYRDFFFGINIKYQLTNTENVSLFGNNIGISGDNLRVGGQVGLTF